MLVVTIPPRAWRGLGLLLAAVACSEPPRVVADGWFFNSRAAESRAFADSLAGLSAGDPPVQFVGLDHSVSSNDDAADGGARVGETWASSLLSMATPGVVVGFQGSAVTNAAARKLAAAGIPIIAPNASAQAAPEVEPYVFRLLPDDTTQGRVMADYAADSLPNARVAVVFVGDAYGVGILSGIRAALYARGRDIVDEQELPLGSCTRESDAAARLAMRALLRRSRPDALLLALPMGTAECVLEEVWSSNPTLWIIGSDALDYADADRWFSARTASAAYVRIVTGWQPRADSVTAQFMARVTARNGRPAQGADALHMDALMLAAAALRATDGKPESVRRWLESLGTQRPAFEGLTGAISFAPNAKHRLSLRGLR